MPEVITRQLVFISVSAATQAQGQLITFSPDQYKYCSMFGVAISTYY